MSTKLVSVIIPTYNREFTHLKRALNSVLSQTYENLEVIVVDDNTFEKSEDLEIERQIKSINDNRIIYLKNYKNLGACASRNNGIKYSKGEYLSFLDDDDEWLPEKIEKQVELFEKSSTNVGLIYCHSNTLNINKREEITKSKIRKKSVSNNIYSNLLLNNYIGSTSFVMIKRQVLERVGYFNEALPASQDYELWLRIAKHYDIKFTDYVLVNYYVHSGERISNNKKAKCEARKLIFDIYYQEFEKSRKIMSRKKMLFIPCIKNEKGTFKAFIYWFKAFIKFPFQLTHFKVLIKNFVRDK